jgi:hypothetical protein
MKTKIFLLILMILSTSVQLSAQDSFQAFPSVGFKVKCGCKLYTNSLFIQMAKGQGMNNIMAAYICAENEDNPEYGVIYNINIYDESNSYENIKPIYHSFFEKKCLEQYAHNLSEAGISYNYTTYQGASAIEYNFDQQGLPTKAIYFLKDKKSYLLQVATRTGLTSKFSALKSSFELL